MYDHKTWDTDIIDGAMELMNAVEDAPRVLSALDKFVTGDVDQDAKDGARALYAMLLAAAGMIRTFLVEHDADPGDPHANFDEACAALVRSREATKRAREAAANESNG